MSPPEGTSDPLLSLRARARRAWTHGGGPLTLHAARGFARHDLAVYAMALAYRGLVLLLPFGVFLAAVVTTLRADLVLAWLAERGPDGLRGELPEQIVALRAGDSGGLLAASTAVALWTVAVGARVLTRALNRVAGADETRPLWKRAAVWATVAPALSIAAVVALGAMLATSRASAWAASWLGLDGAFVTLWAVLRVPVALGLLAVVVATVYRIAPYRTPTLRGVAPGAAIAVGLWALASLGFAVVVPRLPDYGAVYGSLGTAVSLLLYLYVSAAAVLFGAEVNAARRPGIEPGGTREVSSVGVRSGPEEWSRGGRC